MKNENKDHKFEVKFDITLNMVIGILYILFGSGFISVLNPFSISKMEGEGKTILHVISITAILVVFYGIKKIIDAFAIKNNLLNTNYDEHKKEELSEQIEKKENNFLKIYKTVFLSGILLVLLIYVTNLIMEVGLLNLEVLLITIIFIVPSIILLYHTLKRKK